MSTTKIENIEEISAIPIEYDSAITDSNMRIVAEREERKYASHTPRTKVSIIVEEAGKKFIDFFFFKSSVDPETFTKFSELTEKLDAHKIVAQPNEEGEFEGEIIEEPKIVLEEEEFRRVFNMLYDIIQPLIDEDGANVPINREWFDAMDFDVKVSLLEIVVKFFDNIIKTNKKK